MEYFIPVGRTFHPSSTSMSSRCDALGTNTTTPLDPGVAWDALRIAW